MTVHSMTRMQQTHVANHYVPKLYLKQWSASGLIPTYRLLVPNEACPLWKPHSLKGIAYHQHLYTYVTGDATTDEFERWLDREFESPAEEAIDRVVREDRLTSEHWMHLARFAMAQDVRTPARLREFLARQSELMPDLLQRTVQGVVNRLEQDEPPVGLHAADRDTSSALPLKVSIDREPDGGGTLKATTLVGRKMWIWSLRHLLTSTIQKLPRTRWTILHAPSNFSWPTTDNPLVRLNFFSPSNYNFGGGWGVQNGDILLPLSPKHLLHTCIGRKPHPRGTTLDANTALLIRRIIIEHADRYVFAKEPGDIHSIRQRIVSPEACRAERETWQRWHHDQSRAEIELSR
ncbi:DUF4238 domain-containing protein [Stenotrophomonas maltophilia]|nr:DUF4238 domain-containing protein [Stenotrophomonas maltophilia]